MKDRPHIIRMVADRARSLYYTQNRPREALPSPRIVGDEIGVQFDDGRFIPYADLGFNHDVGFYRLSEVDGLPNEAEPFAAAGKLINQGHVLVTTGVAERLSNPQIRGLIDRHTSGDYGSFGEFFDIDVPQEALGAEGAAGASRAVQNKVSTLSGLDAVISEYEVDGSRIWVMTEAGDNRTTVLLFAGPVLE